MKTLLLSDLHPLAVRCLFGLLVLGAASFVGCEKEQRGGERVVTIPVTGQVMLDGKPQSGISVAAEPVNGPTPTNTTPGAFTDPEGNFAVTTYEAGDGVPVGEYKLTFKWGKINLMSGRFEGDQLNGKYSDADKSEFDVKVTESSEPVDLGVIELSKK